MVSRGELKVLGKRRKYFEEELEDRTELLPGLPNDVTVQLICTRLPWRTFHSLSSVSRVWLGAIRSGEINDTRVRSRTAETLAFMECSTDALPWTLALYSLRDRAVYPLPALSPFENKRLSHWTRYVAIGGRVYLLGVMSEKVWVLDVAAQKKWQECASMLTRRRFSGCAVFEGKIYVFGGCTPRREPIVDSEVYDPKVDAWTKVSSMKSARILYRTCIVQDEILVYGGSVYDADYRHDNCSDDEWRPTEGSRGGIEAYNPMKDSWRTIPLGDFGNLELNFEERGLAPGVLFTAHGRLHCLSRRNIDSVDLDEKSVEGLHTVRTRADIYGYNVQFRLESLNFWFVQSDNRWFRHESLNLWFVQPSR